MFADPNRPAADVPCRPAAPPAPPRNAVRQPVRAMDVEALTRQVGHGHRLLSPDTGRAAPLMDGHFSIARLREGMYLHCTDIAHLHDMTTQFVMLEESVKVMLKLEGSAQVRFGKRPLGLDAGQGAGAAPRGAVVTLSAPEDFERRCRAGTRERMVVLTLTPNWFAAAGMDQRLFRDHLAIRPWTPTPRAIAIAEQLVRPATFDGPMHALYQESRALELIAEALARTAGQEQPTPPGLHPADYRRACRLQEFLDSGRADHLDMPAIAQEMGCNPSTLQQQFRLAFGRSIFDYLRESRLQRAALALQREGVSVARAAEIAGYSSQANFSTAFRRHFGQPPKAFRARL